jgi:GTP cyclohydrolase I
MAYHKKEYYDQDVTEDMMAAYKRIIEQTGEDAGREGLIKTPERAAKAMQYNTQGYNQDAVAILNSARFREDVSEMVLVKRHRALFDVRASPASLFWKGAYCLYTQWLHHRPEQAGARGGCLCPPPAGAGASYNADPRRHPRKSQPAGRGRCDRGEAPLHDDARRAEAELRDHYIAFDGEFLDNHITRNEFLKLIGTKLS